MFRGRPPILSLAGTNPATGAESQLAGLITAEIVATVAKVTTPGCFRRMTTVSLPDLTRQTLAVTPMPGCPMCDSPASMGNAGWHEWLAQRWPAELRTPRSTLEPDRPEESADPSEQATGPRLPLPDDGTVFRYHPIEHQLIAVRTDAPELHSCLAGTDLAEPDLALVLVGVPARLVNRHGFSAYRHALLAAGRAVAELLTAASDIGLTVSLASTWDDRLPELLELGKLEVIAAVAGLHSDNLPALSRLVTKISNGSLHQLVTVAIGDSQ